MVKTAQSTAVVTVWTNLHATKKPDCVKGDVILDMWTLFAAIVRLLTVLYSKFFINNLGNIKPKCKLTNVDLEHIWKSIKAVVYNKLEPYMFISLDKVITEKSSLRYYGTKNRINKKSPESDYFTVEFFTIYFKIIYDQCD